jgi:hypothetical protein
MLREKSTEGWYVLLTLYLQKSDCILLKTPRSRAKLRLSSSNYFVELCNPKRGFLFCESVIVIKKLGLQFEYSFFLYHGYWVSGYWVSGYWVSGYWVSGYWVSGYWVSGYWVSGYWVS